MPTLKRWRTARPCDMCPFNRTGAGRELRRGLPSVRWRDILRTLRAGMFFVCHKTSTDAGDGSNLVCAGSITWQAKRGVVADYVQVCERLDLLRVLDTKTPGKPGVEAKEEKHRGAYAPAAVPLREG